MKHLQFAAEQIVASGNGIIGDDLFIGTIPGGVVKAVMLRDSLTGIEIDEGMKNFYSFEFQVIVRDPDVQAGYTRALDIQQALRLNNVANADIHVSWMIPSTLPVTYPRGDAGDLETSFRVRMGYGDIP